MTAKGRQVSNALRRSPSSRRSPRSSGPHLTAHSCPRSRLSKVTGRYPARTSALQAWLPTNPAPPVTRIVFKMISLVFGSASALLPACYCASAFMKTLQHKLRVCACQPRARISATHRSRASLCRIRHAARALGTVRHANPLLWGSIKIPGASQLFSYDRCTAQGYFEQARRENPENIVRIFWGAGAAAIRSGTHAPVIAPHGAPKDPSLAELQTGPDYGSLRLIALWEENHGHADTV